MTMKRLSRSPEKFDVLDLFTSLGRTHGINLRGNGGHDKIIEKIKASFDASKENPILLHGQRTQAMFSYVAASLGNATLIKQEDAGEIFVSDSDLKVPDFHIALLNGSSFLVEVKNHHRDPTKPLILKRSYLQALERYSQLVGKPLRVAIYWSLPNIWTLISLTHLPRANGDCRLDFLKAYKINEMADLGDMQVATTPPLLLRMLTDPTKPRDLDSHGHVSYTIGRIDLYCGGVHIDSEEEKNLAFYFMLYSNWTGSEPTAHIVEGSLIYTEFEVSHPPSAPGQEFEMLGFLSSMISRRFNDLTAPEGAIERLVPAVDPGTLGVVIPPDYKGNRLRLWRFALKPNYD